MSGLLQRLVDRVQGPADTALRRRRPSVFETRDSVPSSLMAFDAVGAPPLPVPPARSEGGIVHSHEIRYHPRADAQPASRAQSAEGVTTQPTTAAHPTQTALPAPPSLRPLPAPPTAAEARRNVPAVAPSAVAPNPSVQRPQRRPDSPVLERHAPRRQPAAEPVDPTPLRRARPMPTEPAPSPPPVPALPLPPRLPATQRAATPVAHPARRAALPAATDTPVHVTIGSVEIRAHAPAPAPQRPASRTASGTAVPSLDAYLRQRHGGPR
ncbi:hypothetical protein [Stenotrophomonas sp. PD6]|uniref:hypothetical protein n=1 Tax=Stenotrophomonas sp. PD6 TaxID=3368612 RepID=UPI003BA1442A